MMKALIGNKKGRALFAAAIAATSVGALISTPASAIDGQQFVVNGGFDSSGANGELLAPSTTDFALTSINGPGGGTGNGSMYDPGRYVIGSNPNNFHSAWITLPEGNPMLIANGFESTNQKVWEQVITTSPCTTPGSLVTFDFTANAMNILSAEWVAANAPGVVAGANISVTINGVPLGASQDLTTSNPGNVVQFVGPVAAAASFDVAIWNNGTAYMGNDFAIDNISLVQRGDCAPPCTDVVHGVWFNYTGNSVGAPALNDPKWHALPATPGGQHDVDVRGFNKPYQVGTAKGKGDWFKWVDDGAKCAV